MTDQRNIKALIINDDPEQIEELIDIITCLGHLYNIAKSVVEARDIAKQNRYNYIVMNIEVRSRNEKGKRRVQNGLNLIDQLRQISDAPIIMLATKDMIAAGYGAAAMRKGAYDVIDVPFPSIGRSLDDAIIECNKSQLIGTKTHSHFIATPTQFEHGEMVFSETRIEFCGVKICGNGDSGVIRKILDILKQKNPRDNYVAYSGEELANLIGCNSGQNGIAAAVRDFRESSINSICEEANILLGRKDIIESGGRGYRLSNKIAIRVINEPENKPIDPVADTGNILHQIEENTINQRQRWIIEQLQLGVKLRVGLITSHYGCSIITAKRDLAKLRARGLITFSGSPKTGFWQIVASSRQETS